MPLSNHAGFFHTRHFRGLEVAERTASGFFGSPPTKTRQSAMKTKGRFALSAIADFAAGRNVDVAVGKSFRRRRGARGPGADEGGV